MPEPRTLKVAIAGCGGIAREHANAYREAGGAQLVAVMDANPEAAAAFGKETGARVAASLAELIERDKPDAVSICTPPGVHLEVCRPLLAAKIAVLCEKPLEADAVKATALRDAALAAKVPFMTAYCHRFHPAILELKRLITAGTLGEPLFFRNIFAGYMALKGNHRVNPVLSGGGTMIDNGSHAADIFRFLVGEPTQVQAMTSRVLQDIPVEDFGMIHLGVGTKAFGEIIVSHSLKVAGNWVEWYGTKGSATVSYWNEGFPDLAYKLEGQDAWTPVDCSKHPERFVGEITHFLECVRTGATPSPSAEDGLKVSRIIAGAYASAGDGRRVAL